MRVVEFLVRNGVNLLQIPRMGGKDQDLGPHLIILYKTIFRWQSVSDSGDTWHITPLVSPTPGGNPALWTLQGASNPETAWETCDGGSARAGFPAWLTG